LRPSGDGWIKTDDRNYSSIKRLAIWAVNHHNRKPNDHFVFQNVVGIRHQNSSEGLYSDTVGQQNSSQAFYGDIVITALDAMHTTYNYEVSFFLS
jgi:hypothetical protein